MSKRSMCQIAMVAVVVFLGCALPASAQAKKGDSEVQLFASFSMAANEAGSAQGDIFGNYGLFATDHVQVGGGPTISIARGNPVNVTFGINAFTRRYFGGSRVQPYVGGEFFMFDVTDPDFSYANALFGVKNYLSERAAIDFKGGYGFLIKEPGSAGLISFQIGLTVLF